MSSIVLSCVCTEERRRRKRERERERERDQFTPNSHSTTVYVIILKCMGNEFKSYPTSWRELFTTTSGGAGDIFMAAQP